LRGYGLMSNDHIDEHEQGERVRKWLRDNGASMLGGVAIGLSAIVGFQFYQGQQDAHRLEAAMQFERFVTAQESGESDSAEGIAAALAADYAETPYPALAALRRSSALLADGKTEDALKALDGAVAFAIDPSLKEVLVLRAARLEVILGRHDAALKRLEGVDLAGYVALRDELKGDAFTGQGKRDEARDAYQSALTATDSASPTRVLIELKLANAGGSIGPEA